MTGGDAVDILSGGSGKDVLTGGNGGDVFLFATQAESVTSASLADRITDFTAGDGDVIQLLSDYFGANPGSLSSGTNYFETTWAGADLAALDTALQNGTIEGQVNVADNSSYLAFLEFTDNSGGEDTGSYLLFDQNDAVNGMSIITELDSVISSTIDAANIAI